MKRFLITLGIMSMMVWLTYYQLGQLPLGVDDAHIFFVYGENLAAGEGIVYNPGGERVEGYSSTLWLLVVALAFGLSANPELWLLTISAIFVAGGITGLWQFVDKMWPGKAWGCLLLAWVFASPGYVVWTSLTLMDSALWSTLLILGAITALSGDSPRRLALFIGLIVLARPEGLLWGLALAGVALLVTAVLHGWAIAIQKTRWPLLAYIITLAGLLLFRMAYFGHPLPNTYYAKVSPDVWYNLWHGTIYLFSFIETYKYLVFLLIGPLVAGLLLNIPWLVKWLLTALPEPAGVVRLRYLAVSLICLIGLFIPVWIGGDHFGLFRFYQPVWPLFILPAFALLDTVWPQVSQRPLRYGVVVMATLVFLVTPQANWQDGWYVSQIQREFLGAARGKMIGDTLNALFVEEAPSLPSVGVITAGGIALTYQGAVIDVMGLNNVVMAHAPGDRQGIKNHSAFNADVFFRQRPDLFLPEAGTPDNLIVIQKQLHSWHNQVLQGILDDEEFLEHYRLTIVAKANIYVIAYIERDYLNGLVERGYDVRRVDLAVRQED